VVDETFFCESQWPEKPLWIDEEVLVRRLLHSFLDKLDKNEMGLTIKISANSAPELFDYYHEDTSGLWQLVQELDHRYHIWSVQLARQSRYKESYENATLRFLPEREASGRHWLHRPAQDGYSLLWQSVIKKHSDRFEDHGCTLLGNIIRIPEHGAEAVVKAFIRVGEELRKPVGLRTLSARCFWGDSKFLDRKEMLVREIYPTLALNLSPRPVLLCAWLPADIQHIVFIENQDTFIELAHSAIPHTGFIYSGGLRNNAVRLRQSGNAVFSFINSQLTDEEETHFVQWWQGEATDSNIKVWFWGDLDFAGMSILKSLREGFPDMDAWKPGYQPLLQRLANGECHDRFSSGKENQLDPECTGSSYADEVLLPRMRETGALVDQEAIRFGDLAIALNDY